MPVVTQTAPAGRAPWHLWVVGVLGILWNGFGCYDYWMSQTQGDVYLRTMGMTEPQITYFNAMPAWMTGVWATGVWGALLASFFLLARLRWAVPAFAVSLGALLVSLLYTYVLSDGGDVLGTQVVLMNVVITVAAVLFLVYSRRMRRRAVLR